MFSIFIMPKLMLVFTLFYGWYLNTSHDICIPDEYHEGHKVYISIDLEFVIIQMTFKVSKTRSEILCRERCSHCSIEDIFRSGPEWRSSWRKYAASDSTYTQCGQSYPSMCARIYFVFMYLFSST